MKAVIYPNFTKESAQECAKETIRRLHEMGFKIAAGESCAAAFAEFEYVEYGRFSALVQDADFAIALGGDGTMLKCARALGNSRAKLLGINTGHLGFMSALEKNELHLLDRLLTGDYTSKARMMLQATAEIEGSSCEMRALNEIHADMRTGRVGEFSVYVDDCLVGTYRSDGVIFSTPTGSTAYALSAGGPVIEPGLSCVEMTVVCPHSLYARPMILSADHKIRLVQSGRAHSGIYVCADGKTTIQLPEGVPLEISRAAETVEIVDRMSGSFFDTLSQKLMRPLKDIL